MDLFDADELDALERLLDAHFFPRRRFRNSRYPLLSLTAWTLVEFNRFASRRCRSADGQGCGVAVAGVKKPSYVRICLIARGTGPCWRNSGRGQMTNRGMHAVYLGKA